MWVFYRIHIQKLQWRFSMTASNTWLHTRTALQRACRISSMGTTRTSDDKNANCQQMTAGYQVTAQHKWYFLQLDQTFTIFLKQEQIGDRMLPYSCSLISFAVSLAVTQTFAQQENSKTTKHAALLGIWLHGYKHYNPTMSVCACRHFKLCSRCTVTTLRCCWLLPGWSRLHLSCHSLTCSHWVQPEWHLEPALSSTQCNYFHT